MIRAWRDLAWVVSARAAVSALVLASGFRAISDDDYARVVIAERWAAAPRLDPSGTSWLPLPLWMQGAAMAVLGPGLAAARAAALVSGLAAAALIYIAARWIWAADDERTARWAAASGAILASCLPLAARLGVATVPELPTAALTLVAVASVAESPPSSPPLPTQRGDRGVRCSETWGQRRLGGACAILAASLSRYEAWPIAALLAAWLGVDAYRARGAARARAAFAACVAAAGPLAWIAHNRVAHGDAFAFAGRVAAYRRALGEGGAGPLAIAWAYVGSTLRAEPELFVLLAGLGAIGWSRRAVLRPLGRPAALVAAMLVALVAAGARDGAPTHHPERALLVLAMVAALGVARLVVSTPRLHAALVLTAAAAAGGWTRWSAPVDDFALRRDEEAIGTLARGLGAGLPPAAPVLVEVVDYGHLAVLAGIGRPDACVPDRDVDPRKPQRPSSFSDSGALRARIAEIGARAVVGRRSDATAPLGEPSATAGAWGLWLVR